MKTDKLEWKYRPYDGAFRDGNYVLSNKEGKVFLSYQPHSEHQGLWGDRKVETAIIIKDDYIIEEKSYKRYLIYDGDWRNELEALYPDVEKLKAHWKIHGGTNKWSDGLPEGNSDENRLLNQVKMIIGIL